MLQAAGQSEPWGAGGDGPLERAGPAPNARILRLVFAFVPFLLGSGVDPATRWVLYTWYLLPPGTEGCTRCSEHLLALLHPGASHAPQGLSAGRVQGCMFLL